MVQQPSGLGGFHNAPVSKGLLAAIVGSSLAVQSLKTVAEIELTGAALTKLQIWRLISSNICFGTPGETLFGAILLYYFRLFERQKGSAKYGAQVLICSAVSTALQAFVVFTTSAYTEGLISGPYGIIFSLFVQFIYDVPSAAHFTLFGIRCSDKSFIYLLALQFFVSSQGTGSIPTICGLLAGIMFRSNFLNMRNFRLPGAVCRVVNSTLGALLRSSPAPQARRPGGQHPGARRHRDQRQQPGAAGAGAGAGAGGGTQGYADQLLPAFGAPFNVPGGMAGGMGGGMGGGMAPPNEASVETLVAMGFPREQALRALRVGHNDLNMATHLLLQGAAV